MWDKPCHFGINLNESAVSAQLIVNHYEECVAATPIEHCLSGLSIFDQYSSEVDTFHGRNTLS
jgi:hypothetical protein